MPGQFAAGPVSGRLLSGPRAGSSTRSKAAFLHGSFLFQTRGWNSAPPRLARSAPPPKQASSPPCAGGARREDAAAAAGFSLTGFYGQRRRDPQFAADGNTALATPAAATRRAGAYAARGAGEVRIASANRRVVQRRRRAHVRFTLERQELFLEHFAATGDMRASARAAGISECTVKLHRRNHPEFAEAYAEALAIAYPRLEDEAVRLRLAVANRLRAATTRGACRASGRPGAARCPTCGHDPDDPAEFDRTMQLLARWDRKDRRVDSRFAPGGQRQRWSFDEAMVEIEKIMRAYGLRTRPRGGEAPPPSCRT